MGPSKALGGFPPTKEQLLIRDNYVAGNNIMVDAGAGSSKTSSSIYITEEDDRKVLYLAYNKAIATSAIAKFPKNVTVKTFHGLAYGYVGYKYRAKFGRPNGGYVNVASTISEIQKFYNIKQLTGCNAMRVSSLVKDTLVNFEHSADKIILNNHVPNSKIEEFVRLNKDSDKGEININNLKSVAVTHATQLWKDRINLNSQVLCTHDTYLKLYQLSKPVLPYDCIIGDEFQDVNPVVADIILNQDTQKVLIGDPNQSIYQWRGAKNFLKDNEGYVNLFLSKSFRYGQEIADLAKAIINYKRELNGFEEKTSTIGKVDKTKQYTKIFRTNAGLLLEAVELINDNIKVTFDINCKDFVTKIYNVLSLKNGDLYKVKHKDIVIFESYDELVEESPYDYDLRKIVSIIEQNKVPEVVDALLAYHKPRNYDVTLTTAHKAKGLEWDNVILAEDFNVPVDKDGIYYELPQGEINLLYVSVTRASKVIEINRAVEVILEHRTNPQVNQLTRIVIGGECEMKLTGINETLDSCDALESISDNTEYNT